MSDPNRGPYPPERPLAFDGYAAQPRARGPAPVTLMLSVLLLLAVGGGVFYLYRGGLRAPDGPPQPVGAPVTDLRVAAPPQAQTPDPAAGLSIYKNDPNAAPAAPAFTPPPEQPTPRPVAAAPHAPAATPVSVLYPVTAAPVSAMPITPGASAVAPGTPIAVASGAKHAKPSSIDTILADAGPAPSVKHTAPLSDAASAPPAKHAGGYAVQIGAFSTQALADRSWSSAAGVAPGAMAGKGKRVAPMTKDGATLYRTAITGFDSRQDAQDLCAKLTAAGRTCFVR